MAPFPEEVDVFTAPHWRMKQLVGLYCDKVQLCGASGSGQRAGGGEARAGSPGGPGLRGALSVQGPRAALTAACAAVSTALSPGARAPPGWQPRT